MAISEKDSPPKVTGGIKDILKGQKAKTMPDKGYDTPNKARRAMVVGLMKSLKKQGKINKVGKGARESTETLAGDMISQVMEGADPFEVWEKAIG
jgi:hypothetical protein